MLLERLKNKVERLELVPSKDGVFEVSMNGKLLFSKKEVDRFPNDEEIISFL